MAERRFRFAPVGVAVLCASLLPACGGGDDETASSDRSTQTAVTLPSSPADSRPAGQGKAAPRWETIVTLNGRGAERPAAFTVLPDAIQWRARWSCDAGSLRVTTEPAPRRPGPLIDSSCPQKGEGFAITSGSIQLTVEASGPWQLIVDQQLDTPLAEPPLPGLSTARVLKEGGFYNVEKEGKGTARIYQLADGTHALRFENFEVSTNTDLFVWLIDGAKPATTVQIVGADKWVLGNLKSTVGDQNYVLPADVPIDRVRSVVIWCEPVRVAYIAAGLT